MPFSCQQLLQHKLHRGFCIHIYVGPPNTGILVRLHALAVAEMKGWCMLLTGSDGSPHVAGSF